MSEFKFQTAGESEQQSKQADAYLFKQDSGTPGFALSGVLSGLAVTQTATASGSVLVAAGLGVYQSSLTSGVDRLVSNATKTLDVLGASPMGALPRNDIVAFNSATGQIVAVIGTPNASPTDPSTSFMLPLARIRNAANATTIPTSAIDDLRTFTALNGVRPTSKLYRRTTDFTLTSGAESVTLANVAPPATGPDINAKVVLSIPGFSATTSDCRVLLRVRDGVGQLIGGFYVQPSTGTAQGGAFVCYTTGGVAAGDFTMTAQRVAGTGNVTIRGVEGWTLEASVL